MASSAESPPPQNTIEPLLATANTAVNTSGIVRSSDGYWFAWDKQLPTSAIVTSVYWWLDGRWRRQAEITVGANEQVIDHGGIDPSAAITVAPLTGSDSPDFLIHTGGADTYWLNVLARIGSRWQFVNFDDAAGATIGEDEIRISGRTIVAGYNNCNPDCASGHVTTTGFRYQSGAFRPDSPAGSCAGELLAAAARLGPYGGPLHGNWGIIAFACARGYAMAVALVQADQTLTFRVSTAESGWVEIANSMGGPQGRIPAQIATELIRRLDHSPQDLYFPY